MVVKGGSVMRVRVCMRVRVVFTILPYVEGEVRVFK